MLDELARRYADELFAQRQKEILKQQEQKTVAARRDYLKHKMSGTLLTALAQISIERTRLLAEARLDTLMEAHKRVGAPFDEMLLGELTEEITAFCNNQHSQEVRFLAQADRQMHGSPITCQGANVPNIERAISEVILDISRNLRIRRLEIALDERRILKAYGAGLGKQWDVFISYASEDEQEFVRPLAAALERSGLSVWYAPTSLKVGDKLRKTIDEGIAKSRFAVVVLSHSYFSKSWPQEELEGVFSREIEGVKVILPVWHKITGAEVASYSPMLKGRAAVKSSAGLDVVVRQLKEAMGLQ